MRSNKEIAEEALRRAAILRRQKAKKRQRNYTITAVAVCLALMAGLSCAIPSIMTGSVTSGAGGRCSAALLFSGGSTGGCVLLAVISFTLGAAVTIFCLKGAAK